MGIEVVEESEERLLPDVLLPIQELAGYAVCSLGAGSVAEKSAVQAREGDT